VRPRAALVGRQYDERPHFAAAVVVGGGPSLTESDAAAAVRWRDADPDRAVVVVNNSYRMLPQADVLYAGDLAWFETYAVDAARKFRGAAWTGSAPAADRWPGVKLVRRVNGDQIPEDGICVGGQMGNSGLQAVAFAALCGAKRIALLGFDGGPSGGRTHWHEPHEGAGLRPCFNSEGWPLMFMVAARQLSERGVAVYNCSRQTRLWAFPRARLAEWISK
jgi:hypothetical protein